MEMTNYGLYTKEVMKHFRRPRNMGRMKNPSGIGKVGNVVCILPGEGVHINNRIESIENITPNDKVLGCNGSYNKVSKLFERFYDGDVIILKNQLGKTILTPDHLVLAIKVPKRRKFFDTKVKRNLPVGWYHAETLERRDIVLFPIFKEVKDIDFILLDIPKAKYDFKSKELPKKIKVNSDFLRLCGYFLSEGNVQEKKCRTFITLTFNIKEKDYVNDTKKIVKKIFGIKVKIRELTDRNTIIVYIYSSILARFFKKLFGNGAKDKKIPDFMISLPLEKQKNIIVGMWRGDGHFNTKRIWPRAGYSTISHQLFHQLKILLLRQKIVPSLYKEKRKIVKGVNHRENFRIHVGDRSSLKKLANMLGVNLCIQKKEKKHSWFDDNYFYTPLTGIEKKKYKSRVRNLEIECVKSFSTESLCLHNCGDVMYIYIKIKKTKKGKDVISDVKFETFGCVAALATSSMITTMAKGKTIEEALKITKMDVAKSLGGLPKIKLHCSVLASDALTEAIYDYLSKNKLPIPEDLEKRHQEIKKETEFVEEKFGEHIKMEKKILSMKNK
jgi:nitrogen fixation NifU-like protein